MCFGCHHDVWCSHVYARVSDRNGISSAAGLTVLTKTGILAMCRAVELLMHVYTCLVQESTAVQLQQQEFHSVVQAPDIPGRLGEFPCCTRLTTLFCMKAVS